MSDNVMWTDEIKDQLLVAIGRRTGMKESYPVVQELKLIWTRHYYAHLMGGWSFNTRFNIPYKFDSTKKVVPLGDAIDMDMQGTQFLQVRQSKDFGAYVYDDTTGGAFDRDITVWRVVVLVPLANWPIDHVDYLINYTAGMYQSDNNKLGIANSMLMNLKLRDNDRRGRNDNQTPGMRRMRARKRGMRI